MKTSRKSALIQRQLAESKLKSMGVLAVTARPPSGWIRAIRGALGITARQLAARMGTDVGGVLRLETRESKGAVTLQSLERAARAMRCRLVYVIVPESEYSTFEAILDERARSLARRLARGVGHSMKLEAQEVGAEDTEAQVLRLASELKTGMDRRLWDKE